MSKKVKDLMLPLESYPVVPLDATLLDALEALEAAQSGVPGGRQPHRAVLVVDRQGHVVGKVGQLGFLKALEPRYSLVGDIEMLGRAGVTPEFVSSMMEHYHFFQGDLEDLCARGRSTLVRDVMRPVTESVPESASLREAIHRIVVWQTLSVLVTSGEQVVGLLRLSDLFEEVSRQVRGGRE